MTRRERLERRAERRMEWAASRDRKSAAGFNRARVVADGIPFGQPILVGHHSERHARADQARIESGMRQGCESADMADHHRSKANGLERQLARSIFSDDDGAAEALEDKAAAIDAEADRCKAINAAWRKLPGDDKAAKLVALVAAGTMSQAEAHEAARLFSLCHWEKQPHPAYRLTNLRANARRCRERVKDVAARAERQATAEAAPGGVIIARHPEANWATVTFAEKPGREVLEALRAAGYRWGSGRWSGYLDRLPEAAIPAGLLVTS